MRIVAISDTHGLHEKLIMPPGDVLIHSGDWTKRGREDEANSFLQWFESQPHDYKILICGNHELNKAPSIARIFTYTCFGMHYLEDEEVMIQGVKFYGSPWTPAFFNWNFMTHSATQRARIWSQVPHDTEVLITHGPPFGILDRNLEGHCCGDYTLMERAYEVKPKVHIFGHIHEDRGHFENDGVRFFNVASIDRSYSEVRLPVVIEL